MKGGHGKGKELLEEVGKGSERREKERDERRKTKPKFRI